MPKKQRAFIIIGCVLLVAAVAAAAIILLPGDRGDVLSPVDGQMTDIQKPVAPDKIGELEIPGFEDTVIGGNEDGEDGENGENTPSSAITLPYPIGDTGLSITRLGRYTGAFMEDGSDTMVVGCLMLVVTNEGEEDVQFMGLQLTDGTDTFEFNITTLPVGKSVMVLEAKGKRFSPEAEYTFGEVTAYAPYREEMSLHSDVISIMAADGKLVVKNISDSDIAGDIYIHYKSADMGIFVGGITYRARVDGLRAGEEKTVETQHFVKKTSKLMFITYNELG